MNDVMKAIRKILPISSLASHHSSPNKHKNNEEHERK